MVKQTQIVKWLTESTLFLLAFITLSHALSLSSCGTITASGSYTLTNNINSGFIDDASLSSNTLGSLTQAC
jgi:hypothetical protein